LQCHRLGGLQCHRYGGLQCQGSVGCSATLCYLLVSQSAAGARYQFPITRSLARSYRLFKSTITIGSIVDCLTSDTLMGCGWLSLYLPSAEQTEDDYEPTSDQPTNQPTNQPTDRPTDQPTNQPTNQLANSMEHISSLETNSSSLGQDFPAFYGTRSFIAVFTKSRHLTVTHTKLAHTILSNSVL
jgi:hypothetical protein